MSVLRSWLLGVIAAAAALSILYALIPKGKLLAIAKVTGGLVLLLVMLRPLPGLDLDALPDLLGSADAIRADAEVMQTETQEALSALIADKTAAYIQAKAAEMGLDCRAEVRCEERGGTPFPAQVTLDIPRSPALEDVIEKDLDIPAQEQFWREAHK